MGISSKHIGMALLWTAVGGLGSLLVTLNAHAEEESKSAGPTAKELAEGIEKFYAEKPGVQVEFTQVIRKKYQPTALKGKERKGIAFFMKPGFMRWDYQIPEQVFYVSDGVTLWVYEPAENVAYKGRVEGTQLFSAMKFLFGSGKLMEEFHVTLGASEKEGQEVVLKSREGEGAFRSITLLVNPATFEIQQTTVEDPLGDRSVIRFDSIRYGGIENPEWFKWTPGKDVRVEELSSRKE